MPEIWYMQGEAFIRWLQAHGHPALDGVFALASFAGEEVFYLLFLPLVYWCVRPDLGRWLAYALLAGAYGNSFLKYLFRTPRPPEVLWRNVLRPEGPGFPSGHAQVSTVVWGTLAAQARRRWLGPLAALLVGLIAFSRVYNGVHYPHDVLGGLVFGLLTWMGLLRLGPRVAAWAAGQPFGRVTGLVTLVAGALVLIHPAAEGLWPAAPAVTTAGTLWGMTVGFLLEQRRVRFAATGSLPRRAARFVVGLGVVSLVYLGGRWVLPVEAPVWLALSLRFVRYALVGLVVAWLAPALFLRLGLASSAR